MNQPHRLNLGPSIIDTARWALIVGAVIVAVWVAGYARAYLWRILP